MEEDKLGQVELDIELISNDFDSVYTGVEEQQPEETNIEFE